MQYAEYGTDNKEVIVLLHGGGLSWWSCQAAAEMLAARFHVVVPILDGHAGSDAPFTTLEHAAAALAAWLDERFGGHVRLISGLSLGAQVLLELLSLRPQPCDLAVVESALVLPMPVTAALIRPAFTLCWPLVRQRWFARLQFRQLRLPPNLFEPYFADTCRIAREDMIRFLAANSAYRLTPALSSCQTRTLVFAGSRERPIMQRSAALIAQTIPGASLTRLPGLHHGEWSISRPADYVRTLLTLLES